MVYAISCSIKRSYDSPGDFLYNDYVYFFEEKGIELVLISNAQTDIGNYFNKMNFNGLILSGGNDIGSEPSRDAQETALLENAIKHKLPVLGICRGMQFINHYFGDKLPVELVGSVEKAQNHVVPEHRVDIVDPIWEKLIGSRKINTNSFHKQGFVVDQISEKLKVLAISETDTVVEALCHREYPIVGIQWHPERKSPDDKINNIIIESLKNKTSYWSVK